jgi:hypothetical protein
MDLSDREQIIDVITNYTRAIDTGDWDRLRSVFLPDAKLDYEGFGGTVEPFDDAGVRFYQDWKGYVEVAQHLIVNHSIEVDGDDATMRCDIVGVGVNNTWEGGNTVWIAGVEDMTFKRTAEGWKCSRLAFRPTWSAGNVAALTG